MKCPHCGTTIRRKRRIISLMRIRGKHVTIVDVRDIFEVRINGKTGKPYRNYHFPAIPLIVVKE